MRASDRGKLCGLGFMTNYADQLEPYWLTIKFKYQSRVKEIILKRVAGYAQKNTIHAIRLEYNHMGNWLEYGTLKTGQKDLCQADIDEECKIPVDLLFASAIRLHFDLDHSSGTMRSGRLEFECEVLTHKSR